MHPPPNNHCPITPAQPTPRHHSQIGTDRASTPTPLPPLISPPTPTWPTWLPARAGPDHTIFQPRGGGGAEDALTHLWKAPRAFFWYSSCIPRSEAKRHERHRKTAFRDQRRHQCSHTALGAGNGVGSTDAGPQKKNTARQSQAICWLGVSFWLSVPSAAISDVCFQLLEVQMAFIGFILTNT